MAICNCQSSEKFRDDKDGYEENKETTRSQSSAELSFDTRSPLLSKRPSTSLEITTVSLFLKKSKENTPNGSLRKRANRPKRMRKIGFVIIQTSYS
jgi:hypothetical protein